VGDRLDIAQQQGSGKPHVRDAEPLQLRSRTGAVETAEQPMPTSRRISRSPTAANSETPYRV